MTKVVYRVIYPEWYAIVPDRYAAKQKNRRARNGEAWEIDAISTKFEIGSHRFKAGPQLKLLSLEVHLSRRFTTLKYSTNSTFKHYFLINNKGKILIFP